MVLPITPQADFQAAVLDQLRRAPLEPAAQKALLEVLIAAARPAKAGRPSVVDPLAKWLGDPPANAAQLEFEALRRSFALRHQHLACTIGTAEVTSSSPPAAARRCTTASRPAPCWGSLIKGNGASPSGSSTPIQVGRGQD
jgi:hypothetical protein